MTPDGGTGAGGGGRGPVGRRDGRDVRDVPRRVLAELRAAGPGTDLSDIARRVGASRDDVDAAIGYWLHRGELSVRQVDCAPADCGACVLRSAGCAPARPAAGNAGTAGNRASATTLSLAREGQGRVPGQGRQAHR